LASLRHVLAEPGQPRAEARNADPEFEGPTAWSLAEVLNERRLFVSGTDGEVGIVADKRASRDADSVESREASCGHLDDVSMIVRCLGGQVVRNAPAPQRTTIHFAARHGGAPHYQGRPGPIPALELRSC
jgi:hypothetical protein